LIQRPRHRRHVGLTSPHTAHGRSLIIAARKSNPEKPNLLCTVLCFTSCLLQVQLGRARKTRQHRECS
jgi:hypothetical protein